MGALISKVMWVGRATTFCVGLAVILAVVFGIATTALAAVPGDPFRLGRVNTLDQLTTLAGTVAGPLLKLDNNGTGSALSLETEAGVAPMKISAGSGKVTNLNADRLDGKDSSEFLAANAKATDSAHADKADTATSANSAATADNADTLDGKDSTTFLGAGQKAADANLLDGKDSADFYAQGDKIADASHADQADSASRADNADTLDGLDSSQFMRVGKSNDGRSALSDSTSPKTIVVECSSGQRALSGHAEILAPANQFPVALQSVGVYGQSAWRATAAEMVPYEGSWFISASVRCVPDQKLAEAAAQVDLRNAAAAATACSANNDGSYIECDSAAKLSPYGFKPTDGVVFRVTSATVDRWVAESQHVDGGSAYRYDTAAVQQITAIPRF